MRSGAGEGNRTLVVSLEGFCSTIELHPQAELHPPEGFRPVSDNLACEMDGGGGWIRTNVDVRQRVYSPSPLATRAPLRIHKVHAGNTGGPDGAQYEQLQEHVNRRMRLERNFFAVLPAPRQRPSLTAPQKGQDKSGFIVIQAPMAKRKKHSRQGRRDPQTETSEGAREAARRAQKSGGNWLYGVHACVAALANPERDIRRIVCATQSAEDLELAVVDAANAAYEMCEVPRPQIEWRDRRELDELVSRDAVHQGIVVETHPLPHPVIEDVIEAAEGQPSACVVVLDQATDPRNIGAVMRTAAAFGALGVIVQDKHAPDITGALAKAASGAVERLPYVKVTNISRALDQLKAAEFWCVGFDGHTEDMLSAKTLQGRNALVLGAEGAGLRRLTRETCDLVVKIPMSDAVESLNLSNAAAIALYQFKQSNA